MGLPIIGLTQAANFGSLISTESCRLSLEISCHDITEPLATTCRSASIVLRSRACRQMAPGKGLQPVTNHTTAADLHHGLKTLCRSISMSLFVPLLEFNQDCGAEET
jgi:hypothetical protein